MVENRLRGDASQGIVALFDLAPAIAGQPTDWTKNDPRVRPMYYPDAWLANLYFHSSFDNLEVAFDTKDTVKVNHVAVAAKTEAAGDDVTITGDVVFQAYKKDTLLLNHNLGYIPWFKVANGNRGISAAFPIQKLSGGRGRYVSVWATTTQIWLSEIVDASSIAVPALNGVIYRVIVFRKPPAPTKNAAGKIFPLIRKGADGIVHIAGDRFRSDRSYLQVVPGGSPFALSRGRTMDAKNGAPRFLLSDGTVYDPITSMKMSLVADQFGPQMTYNGTAKVGPLVLVQAP